MITKEYTLGISTTVDYSIDIETLIRLFAQHQFRFISIGADLKHNLYDQRTKFRDVKSLAADLNIEIGSFHVPFNTNYNIADYSKPKRLKAIENVLDFLNYMTDLEISLAILHPHYYLPDNDMEKTLQISIESLESIIEEKPDGIKIAIENLPGSQGSLICDRLLQVFDKDRLGLCYDSSHENMSGPPFHLLSKYFKRLVTCHLSDNHGYSDRHLIPGDGNINWIGVKTYFDRAPHFSRVLFEVGTGDPLDLPADEYIEKTYMRACQIFNSG